MLRSYPFHPKMNLNLSLSIFAISYIRRWTRLRQCQHSREFNAYRYRIYISEISAVTVFTSFNFHIFWFSSFRFSGKGEVDVYRMCMCMCMCFITCDQASLFFELFRRIDGHRCISHTNSYNNAIITQCHVDGNQRAWATCAGTH